MKKYQHGRNYMRARRSVNIGRDKKKIRKFNRGMRNLSRAIAAFSDALPDLVNGIAKTIYEFQKLMTSIEVKYD